MWTMVDTEYDSVEREFQHNKLESHGYNDEADEIMELDDPKEVMFRAREVIKEDVEQ